MVENHFSPTVAAESARVVIAANFMTAVLASRLVKGLENNLPSNDARRVARLTIGGGFIPLTTEELVSQEKLRGQSDVAALEADSLRIGVLAGCRASIEVTVETLADVVAQLAVRRLWLRAKVAHTRR